MALSPDGGHAFFARAGVGQVVDTRTGAAVGPARHHAHLTAAVLGPGGSLLVTATTYTPQRRPSLVKVWEKDGAAPVWTYQPPGDIHGMQMSADGRLLALACWRGTVVLDVARRQARWTLREERCAHDLAFSRDGRLLAVGYRGGFVNFGAGYRVWSLETGQPAGPLQDAWSWWAPAQVMGFVGDEKTLVVLDPDARRLTQLEVTGGGYHAMELGVRQPRQVATAPASRFLAVSNGLGGIELWDARERTCHRVLTSGADVQSLHLSVDGKSLAAVCASHSVRLWDTTTGLPLGPELRYAGKVAAVRFSPDGRELTVALESGQVSRWHLPEAMSGSVESCERRLKKLLGMVVTAGEVGLLSPESWHELRKKPGLAPVP